MGGLLTLYVSLSCAGQQVVSCQWNSLETLQEAYIVLYKLFPPNNRRKEWTSLERWGGTIYWEKKFSERWEMCPAKKQTNKHCGRKSGGYQSSSSTKPSGRFLAAGALTSKKGLVPCYTVLDRMAGLRHVYLRATSTNLIKATNTQARYVCSPERHTYKDEWVLL